MPGYIPGGSSLFIQMHWTTHTWKCTTTSLHQISLVVLQYSMAYTRHSCLVTPPSSAHFAISTAHCLRIRYIKQLKMEILTLIASSTNVYDIVGELTEYARDISSDTARLAVKAVGRIALSVRVPADPATNHGSACVVLVCDASSSSNMSCMYQSSSTWNVAERQLPVKSRPCC